LCHEIRLLIYIATGNERRRWPRFLNRFEFLGELLLVVRDGGVGEFENLRGAAVIDFQTEDPGVRIAFGEGNYVLKRRPAKAID